MKRILLAIFALLFVVAGLSGCGTNVEATPPVLNVSGVPESGTVGRTVVLPAAEAADGSGADIGANCKVTVTRLNADGSDKDDLINARPANVEQKFIPVGNDLLNYKIVYSVRDDAGSKTERKFTFTAVVDTEKPVMTFVKEGEFEDFDPETGVAGRAGEEIALPKVSAVKSDGFDASANARITVLTTETSPRVVKSNIAGGEIQNILLIPGEYRAVYSLTDASGNVADELSFPLSVGAPDLSENLIFDQDRFVLGFDSRFNEYGELEVGKTPEGDQSDNPTSAVMNLMKLHGETVGIAFSADPYAKGGDTLFDISFLGTKSRDRFEPDGGEGMWSPYFVLRITENGRINFRVASIALGGSGSVFATQKEFDGNLRDGKNHVIYIRFEFEAERATAKLWVDRLPSEPADYEGSVERGTEHGDGQLPADVFDELKDTQSGAGWLSFGGAAMNGKNPDTGKYGGSIMRVSGVAVYPAGTVNFDVDITPPEMTFGELPVSSIVVDSDYALPVPALSDGTLVKKITTPDGSTTEWSASSYSFAATGTYTLTYVATDAAGNVSYRSFSIVCHVEDHEPPAITVDKTPITIGAGESVVFPEASAADTTDGDLTDRIKISVEGPYRISNASGSAVIKAAGRHYIVYAVTDLAGNTAIERVPVDVTTKFASDKNYLENGGESGVTVRSGNYVESAGQFVYDEKISYRISFSQFSGVGIVQFNLRNSEHDSGDGKLWMSGMVLRIIGGKIEVSANKHDSYVFGSMSNPFALAYWANQEVILEYRLSDVKIGEEDFLKFELWINGQKQILQPERAGSKDANDDLILPVSAFGTEGIPADNLSAGPIRVSAQNNYEGFTVKEIGVDKVYASYPENPEPPMPEGIPMSGLGIPAAPPAFESTAVDVAQDQSKKLADSFGGYTAKFKLNVLNLGSSDSLVLTLSGTPINSWGHGAGLTLTYRADSSWVLTYGGRNDDFKARFWTPALTLDKDYFCGVRIGYVASTQDDRILEKLTVEFWFGESEAEMSPVKLLGTEDTVFELDAAQCETIGADLIRSEGLFAGSPLASSYRLQMLGIA